MGSMLLSKYTINLFGWGGPGGGGTVQRVITRRLAECVAWSPTEDIIALDNEDGKG